MTRWALKLFAMAAAAAAWAGPATASTVDFLRASYTVSERADFAVVRVQRTGDASQEARVTVVTRDGTAAADTDYQNTAVELIWAPEETSVFEVEIPIIESAEAMPDRSFSVELVNPVDTNLGGTDTAEVTIRDVSAADGDSSVSLLSAERFVNREDGAVTVQVARDGDVSQPASVDFRTVGGSAQPAADYEDTSGRLTWASGEGDVQEVTIPLIAREDAPGQLEFQLELRNPIGADLGGIATSAITLFSEQEAANAGTVEFLNRRFFGDENGGFVEVSMVRLEGTAGEVSADVVTQDGDDDTAQPNEDYEPTLATVSWGAGETGVRSFAVPVFDDDLPNGDLAFSIEVLRTTGGLQIGAIDTAEGIIVDDDEGSPGTFAFDVDVLSVAEGDGVAVARITRTGGSDGAVDVEVATSDGSAVAGEHYEAIDTTVRFGGGDVDPRTVTVPIIDNESINDERFFSLRIQEVGSNAAVGSPRNVEVTITDDDDRPEGSAAFQGGAVRVSADDGLLRVPVSRVDGSEGPLTVEYRIVPITAEQGEHFAGDLQGTLSWADGESGDRTLSLTLLQPRPHDGRDKTLDIVLVGEGDAAPQQPPDDSDAPDVNDDSSGDFEDDGSADGSNDGNAQFLAARTKQGGDDILRVTITPPRSGDNSLGGSFGWLSLFPILVLVALRRWRTGRAAA